MDSLNQRILAILSEDARLTAKNIATMLEESEETVTKAIKQLEDNGTILKYMTLINEQDYNDDSVDAMIEVKVIPQKLDGFDAIAKEIYKYSQVKSVYLMSGGYDILVMVSGKNLKDVAMFVSENLATIEDVQSTATHFILKKYKVEGVALQKNEDTTRLKIKL